jgi:hypothetical protein
MGHYLLEKDEFGLRYIRRIFPECQTIALANVLSKDEDKDLDYSIRQIFRKYSEVFLTPLHEVQELPLEFVLTNYYEYLYEDWVKDDKPDILAMLEQERVRLSETFEERLAREKKQKEEFLDDNALLMEAEQESKQFVVEHAKRVKEQLNTLAEELEKNTEMYSAVSTFNGPIKFKDKDSSSQVSSSVPQEVKMPQSIKQSKKQIAYEELRELDNLPGYDD